MAKAKPVAVAPKLVTLLQGMDPEDRRRAVHAAFMMMGDEGGINLPGGGGGGGDDERRGETQTRRSAAGMTAKDYFDAKKPKGKVEEFAVAASYREEHEEATATSKSDFQAVLSKARRNWDPGNFVRDISKAKRRRFFTSGGSDQDGYVLSHYGQRYVETLPDRAAAKKLPGGKRVGLKKKSKAGKK